MNLYAFYHILFISLLSSRLDYDFLERHHYEFEITATDNAPEGEQKSGSTRAQVWMRNVNDEEPRWEPTAEQTVFVKEGARQGDLVHTAQVYDPDGDNINFQFTGK